MAQKTGFIHSGSHFHLSNIADPAIKAFNITALYAPELTAEELNSCDSIYLGARQHPKVLEKITPLIIDFLALPGKRAFIDGENQVWNWLPGTDGIVRGTNFWSWRIKEDVGSRLVNPEHQMWNYLNKFAVLWHYHAVLAPPEAATPLAVLEEVPGRGAGEDPWGHDYLAVPEHPNVLLYHDDCTFNAEIVVATMDASYHHGSGFMPGASQMVYRMLRWLKENPQV
ncbi:hypothetical protein [Corynebacterium casei]|uniref:hypothetical protein n=1 Tax=Corynebacterium casei TaxID=160386 RepID=UPI003F914DB4